jgi:predicted  nucleic acid-binding Zn-ribbon protein
LSSHEISADIEGLQHELTKLRGQVEEDSSAFSNLELEVTQLRESLARAQQAVVERESRLAERQRALEKAKHLERLAAYEDDLRMHRKAADEAARAGHDLLAAVEAYEDQTVRLRQILEEMRNAFGTDERVSEVEAVLEREPEKLRATWEAIIGAIRWRLDDQTENRPVEVAKEDLSEELQDIAQSRPRALIKEYFGKS